MAEIMFPVGRMIGGSVYNANPRYANDGKTPLLNSDGTPQTSFSIGVAIPKKGEAHWSQTDWGAVIKAEADSQYGAFAQSPTFSWKITDGDSPLPNKKGKVPREQVGYPGNWILWFSQSWAPKLCSADGSVELTEPEAIMPGYYVQVFGTVAANGTTREPAKTPGVYLNPIAIARSAYGERIIGTGVDTTNLGFGAGVQLPPGASTVPVAAMTAPAATYIPPVTPVVTPPPPVPNPAILHVPVKQMQPSAGEGVTYEAMIAAGWTDEAMIAAGHMKIV